MVTNKTLILEYNNCQLVHLIFVATHIEDRKKVNLQHS